MKILLASRSARRRDILEMLGVPFRISVPDEEEAYTGDPEPEELVTGLACRKARAALPLALPEECIVAAVHSVSGAAKQMSGFGNCPRRKSRRMSKPESLLTRPAGTAFRSAARRLSTE